MFSFPRGYKHFKYNAVSSMLNYQYLEYTCAIIQFNLIRSSFFYISEVVIISIMLCLLASVYIIIAYHISATCKYIMRIVACML